MQVAWSVPFQRLARVLFTAAAAGSVEPEVTLGASEPFRQATGRSLGVLQLRRDGLAAADLVFKPDGGLPTANVLTRAFGPPRDDGVALISVEESVPVALIAGVVQACRQAGYRVALTPVDPTARPGPSDSMVAPLTGPSTTGLGGPEVLGSLDKALTRKVIHANREQVRACYEALLGKKPAAGGKVSVKFVIAPTGAVRSAEAVADDVGDPGLATCLTSAVQTWDVDLCASAGTGPLVPGSVADRWVRKVVQETGGFDNVLYQDGNEVSLIQGYSSAWTTSLRDAVRDEERRLGFERHLIGTNADDPGAMQAVDFVELHQSQPATVAQCQGKPCLVNEYNPNPPLTAAQFHARFCAARAQGTSFWFWRHGQSDAVMRQSLALLRQGCP